MKIKSIIIHNISKIQDAEIPIDKNLNLFFGMIRQGKTTILESVKLAFGGSISNDLLTHGMDEGFVRIDLDPIGYIKRSFYRDSNGHTKVKQKIEFVDSKGEIVAQPAQELKKFLNPFLLDQDYFSKMTLQKKKQYFTELFDIDISEIVDKQNKLKNDAKSLRAKIKLYGDIDCTLVEKPEVDKLRYEKTKLVNKLFEEEQNINTQNKIINDNNLKIELNTKKFAELTADIERLNKELGIVKEFLKNNIHTDLIPMPNNIRIKELEEEIADARVNEVKYEQYLRNIEKNKDKQQDVKLLANITQQDRVLEEHKIKKLVELSKETGIPELEFKEDAILYEGTSIDLLSGSQEMRLSSALAGLYPNDLGISLIDKAAELGEDIFKYISIAKEKGLTILAAIVGKRHAEISEEVGVWVVDDGKIAKEQ